MQLNLVAVRSPDLVWWANRHQSWSNHQILTICPPYPYLVKCEPDLVWWANRHQSWSNHQILQI
ncbi:hypothetical protein, partial [Moorena sp. SIO4A1]|uniref:hypothetical protein n=1 Tax=Moorena sp. SIO4A1 TaxID=2607835 RepID=UPI0025D70402